MPLTKITHSMIANAPADVTDFGADKTGVADSSAAVNAAVMSGAKLLYFPAGTYLVKNVELLNSITIYGDGFATVIKSISFATGGRKYSRTLFSNSSALDEVVIRDMILDGDGTEVNGSDPASEYPLVLLQNVQKISFENVRVTRHSANWDGTTKSVFARHFQAITIRNDVDTQYVKFFNMQLRDNCYEQVDVYHPYTSECITTIDNCSEINTLANPLSHTAFMVTGGHLRVTNSFFKNTKFSTININNTKSTLVDNNKFLDQYQIPLSQVVNVGHSLWYGCDNVTITNNYFKNCDTAAINYAGGNGCLISNNIIVDGGLQPIRVSAVLTDGTGTASDFSIAFPDYPVPTVGISYDLKITNNIIAGATYTSGPTSRGIWINYANPSLGYWDNVLIQGNTISMLDAPNDTHYPLWIDDVNRVVIDNNLFNYKYTAIFSAGRSDNVKITNNFFGGNVSTQSNDIAFTGGGGTISSQNLHIENNTFVAIPGAQAHNIEISFGRTFTGIWLINNIGTKPGYLIDTSSEYYASSDIGKAVTAAPTTGIYRKFDHIKTIPAPGRPQEYVCIDAGSFATYTATGSGISGEYKITVTDGTQFLPGQRIRVNGVGNAGSFKYFVICSINGNVLNTAEVVETTASGQTVTAVNPTFVSAANYS